MIIIISGQYKTYFSQQYIKYELSPFWDNAQLRLATIDNNWQQLEKLATFGNNRQHLATVGNKWQQMATTCNTWQQLAIIGNN
jgi:hypothetical protein